MSGPTSPNREAGPIGIARCLGASSCCFGTGPARIAIASASQGKRTRPPTGRTTRGSDTAADHAGEVTLPRRQGRCQPALALGRREVDISLHCDPRRLRLALPRLAHPRRWLLGLYVASAALVTVREGILTPSNNFRVFRAATRNLLAGQDLYAAHPEHHFDYYKYSPTFALLFAPLAYLPFALAFLCWSLLNALLLWYALDRLLPERPATVALALVYLEVLFSMQYGQSNALVAALLILAFVALEQGRQERAAALLGVDAFIKIFPLAGVSFALLHPRRARFALLAAAALLGLALLPLAVMPPHELATQYRSWRSEERRVGKECRTCGAPDH